MCSIVQQKIKGGHYVDLNNIDCVSLQKKINKIKDIFNDCNPIIIPYKRYHFAGTVGLILDAIGIDMKNISYKNLNISLNNKIIRLRNELNKKEPIIVDGKINDKHIKINDMKKIENDDKKFLLTKQELFLHMDEICKENEYLLKELGKEFCDVDFPTCD